MRHSNITLTGDIIGLDLGKARTGVARINTVAKIAEPLAVIDMKNSDLHDVVRKLIVDNSACAVVVGAPRGLDGQTTEQTLWAKNIEDKLSADVSVPVFSVDEAGTTVKAQERAGRRQSVDSVAAGIILEDFIREVNLGKVDNVSF